MIIKAAATGDIHLGHPNTPTKHVSDNVLRMMEERMEVGIDILFLCGDVFDRLLKLGSEDSLESIYFATRLLVLCVKYNVKLRILRGTPSHDWEQSAMFTVVNASSGIGADIKYIRDLHVEYIGDLTVLYVPDEWNETSEKTLAQAKKLIKETGRKQVDIAIMHGQFEFQLPEFVKAQKHSSREYKRLVRGPIIINHVHKHSRSGSIIAPGSPDRLSHGEEENKGIVSFSYDTETGDFDWKFHVNKNAKIYKTIKCDNNNVEEALKLIDDAVTGLPFGSAIRISAKKNAPILSNLDSVSLMFSQFEFSKHIQKEEEEPDDDFNIVNDDDDEYTPITITPENVSEMLIQRSRSNFTDSELALAMDILGDLLNV